MCIRDRGYTMVYGIIELINFAHGEIFMCGSFVSWWLLTTLGFSGAITDPLLLLGILALAFAVSMLAMGVVGVVIERLAYRRLRNAPRLAPLITAIGVSVILQHIVFVVVSNSIVTTPQIIPNTVLTFGFFSIGLINLFVIILAVGLMAALQLFIGGFADAGVFVLLAIGLNVVVGFAGLLDLGYAAFFAIGAYTYAYGASPFSGLDIPFWPMLLVGAIVAAMFGVLLGAPTLRLRGDYLAIVTLGFGEIAVSYTHLTL